MVNPAPTLLTLIRTSDGYSVQVNGRGTMRESPTLHEFGICCLEKNQIAKLTVDLSRCDYVDSTFLGCLLALHRCGGRSGHGRFCIAAPAPRRRALFESSRFGEVFEQIERAPEPIGEPVTLIPTTLDSQTLGQHILECHRQLAEVQGPNQAAFASVAQSLADELERSQRGRS